MSIMHSSNSKAKTILLICIAIDHKIRIYCQDCNKVIIVIPKPLELYTKEERNQMITECYSCKFQDTCPGSVHISCKKSRS